MMKRTSLLRVLALVSMVLVSMQWCEAQPGGPGGFPGGRPMGGHNSGQRPRPGQLCGRGQPLPTEQPAIVQQPAHRAGHRGHVRPLERQHVVQPVERAQRPVQGGCAARPGAHACHAEPAGEVFSVALRFGDVVFYSDESYFTTLSGKNQL